MQRLHIGGARVELGNMAHCDGHMIDLVETYDEDDVSLLENAKFCDKIITQNFTASGDICVLLDQQLERLQIHGVTLALLLGDIGQVLLFKHIYVQCKYMLLTSSLFCFMFTLVKFCGQLRGTVGPCEYAIVKQRAVAQGCVSYICLLINCAIILYLFARNS